MTGEEMERAIEFLLKNQADFAARQDRTDARLDELTAQVSETGRQLATYAQTQSQFIEIVTTAMTSLAESQAQTDAKLKQTDDRLNKLIGLFEQHIIAGH
jgi:prefoldin subunit 5